MIRTFAKPDNHITGLERKNGKIARAVAAEGIVLLKNEGVLPVSAGKIALFGEGATHTVKGGTGSGEVNARHIVSIREGLESAGYQITTAGWLDDYQRSFTESKQRYLDEMRKKSGVFNFLALPYILSHPFNNPAGRRIEEADLSTETDTCFYVISRQAGENVDRRLEAGDVYLTETEIANIETCVRHYAKTIIVINVGGMIDLTPLDNMKIGGIIFFCQQGGEGGHAFADLVSGKITPSGHLTASWPMQYEDIPGGENFSYLNDNTKEEEYREGIYVGYRYYDSFGVRPRYPFGFGLSYTTFAMQSRVSLENTCVRVETEVKNTGTYAGKAVVQIYASCPAGKLDKEYQRLVGFAKTKELTAGESQMVEVWFEIADMASYDDKNKQFVLEKGNYLIRAGASSRETKAITKLFLDQNIILSRHEAVCPQKYQFEELSAKPFNFDEIDVPVLEIKAAAFKTVTHVYEDVFPGCDEPVEQQLLKLTDVEKAELCVGAGLDIALPQKHFFIVPGAGGYTTSKFEKRGIPAIPFCDGPAGLRLYDVSVEKGNTVRMVNPVMAFMQVLPAAARFHIFGNPKRNKPLYQYATAFPVGMAMAQTWNTEVVTAAGRAIQSEMETFGVTYWLAPGMNIYRNPLCGRNYEYYSEDPLLSGKMAAAVTKGVQIKEGYYTTIKHFCCNNQETNRRYVSENVSERALREIYLQGFKIAITEGRPGALMTSYNMVNGVYTAESHDLCTKILRNEWKFDGLVMTDWITEKDTSDAAKSLRAGVNLIMPGMKHHRKQIKQALREKTLGKTDVKRSAVYIMRGILKSAVYQLFLKEKNES